MEKVLKSMACNRAAPERAVKRTRLVLELGSTRNGPEPSGHGPVASRRVTATSGRANKCACANGVLSSTCRSRSPRTVIEANDEIVGDNFAFALHDSTTASGVT